MTSSSDESPRPAFQTSRLLSEYGFLHAFFGRRGGVSLAPFDELNFSVNVGDDPVAVAKNLELAADCLGLGLGDLHFATQVHGNATWRVGPEATREVTLAQEVDALITDSTERAIGVRTADCVPVLFACPDTGWVGSSHAGWRGCQSGVVLGTVRALREQNAGRILAAIGPHIEVGSFEVSEDVAGLLVSASPDPTIVDRSRDRPHVDLRRMVRAQLESVGIAATDIDDVPGCTYADAKNYFSHRRDGAKSGRLLSAIRGRRDE